MKTLLTIIFGTLTALAIAQNTPPKETTVYYNAFSWNPDGITLCFSVIVMDKGVFDKTHWEIGAINTQTREVKRITTNTADDDWPAYAPDGKRIVFQSERDGSPNIYVMDADGKQTARLTNNRFNEYHPAWSPDGKTIMFVTDRDGNQEIYKMNADGSGQTRLTNTPYKEFNPQWSPDGRKILYYYEKGDHHDQLYMADNDGKNSIKLSSDSTHNYYPSWAPNGKVIIYAMDSNLWQMRLKNPKEKTKLMDGVSYAKFSPNGKKIAFKKGNWPSTEIWLCDADGSNAVQVTDAGKMIGVFGVGK